MLVHQLKQIPYRKLLLTGVQPNCYHTNNCMAPNNLTVPVSFGPHILPKF